MVRIIQKPDSEGRTNDKVNTPDTNSMSRMVSGKLCKIARLIGPTPFDLLPDQPTIKTKKKCSKFCQICGTE